MSAPARLLAVDDEAMSRALCRDILGEAGYAVDAVGDATEALARLSAGRYDLVLTDLHMPGGDGLDLIRRARAAQGGLSCVVFSASPTVDDAVQAMRAGADDFVAKPFDAERLCDVVRRTLDARTERREPAPWDGGAALPRPILELIERVAATSAGALPGAEALPAGPAARFRDAKMRAIRHFEFDYLDRLLTACAGNVTRAARAAGLKRSALQRLMRKCGLDSRHYRGVPLSPRA